MFDIQPKRAKHKGKWRSSFLYRFKIEKPLNNAIWSAGDKYTEFGDLEIIKWIISKSFAVHFLEKVP